MEFAMTLKPRVSEKAYGLSQTAGVYVFEVPGNANKLTVARAVADLYKVGVVSVNIVNMTGKSKRTYRKRQGWVTGKKADLKKAYVTLKEGDSIAIFPAEEDKDAEASKQPAKSKKATRSTK
jgi:large subunit ribosomal protein L23